ncbi:putative aldehyde dehydrogenase protein [Neofusicoccum parvum UCRNP2]|uniref:Putative aldehyde dehydrogenase protein n=1 Tax=Botryosphaeria parva (strain UCR-NP2) TaxID=1287680 RepID=R1GS28_BOTPV|nr:putative aldehyde dehydrogenase protein [Neofusicoccum parvum UCRNP2]
MAAADKGSSLKSNFFINNEYTPPSNDNVIPLYNPATEEFITSVPIAGRAEVDAAVAGAWEAFKNGPWSTFTGAERAKRMLKLADLIEENIEELVALETLTMGQPAGLKEMIKTATVDAWRCECRHSGE